MFFSCSSERAFLDIKEARVPFVVNALENVLCSGDEVYCNALTDSVTNGII